jgi:hypothetical protein
MQTPHPSPSKARIVAGNILITLGGLALLGGGLAKFAHVPKVAAQMTLIGFSGDKLLLVATLEVLAALLVLFRPARPFGLLFVSSYLGGSICAHVQSNQYFEVVPPMIVMGICWLGVVLRHPQALWSAAAESGSAAQVESATGQGSVRASVRSAS